VAYEPTSWKSGDVVTSAKLNKLEQGVAAAGGNLFVVNVTAEWVPDQEAPDDGWYTYIADKTPQEIENAYNDGAIIVVDAGNGMYIPIDEDEDNHSVLVPRYLFCTGWVPDEDTLYEYGYPVFKWQYVDAEYMRVIDTTLELTQDPEGGNSWSAYASPLSPTES